MFRIRFILVLLALIASACASSTTVVGESGAGPLVGATLTDAELAAALATPVPRATPIGGAAPEPTQTPEWVFNSEAAGGANADAAMNGDAQTTSASEVADKFVVGGCYSSANSQAGDAIPCTQAHQSEVIMIDRFSHGPDDVFPGVDVVNHVVESGCAPVAKSFELIDVSGMAAISLVPIPRQWAAGDRSYVCFIQFDKSVNRSLVSIAAAQRAEWDQDRVAEQDKERAAQEQARAAQEATNHEAAAQQVAAQQIYVGDCAGPDGITKVPCNQSPSYEAYARANLASAGGVYPGIGPAGEQAEEYCWNEHAGAGLSGSIVVVYPSEVEWEDYGVYAATCLVSTAVPTPLPVEDLVTASLDGDDT